MRIKIESRHNRQIRLSNWHRWFAWHPVFVRHVSPGKDEIAWLTFVWRKRDGIFLEGWEYSNDEQD